ncbi:MAG: RDD family protein [Nitrosomonadaceae bacterium]
MNCPKTIETSIPGFWRRLLSMTYELLLLVAVLFIAGLIFHLMFHDTDSPFFKIVFQLYLLSVAGIDLIWFWTHGGQTLAMQTWKLRVISADGKKISMRQAIARYLFAVTSISFFGCGILWALFDRDRQFLHDRLAGTKIINVEG